MTVSKQLRDRDQDQKVGSSTEYGGTFPTMWVEAKS